MVLRTRAGEQSSVVASTARDGEEGPRRLSAAALSQVVLRAWGFPTAH